MSTDTMSTPESEIDAQACRIRAMQEEIKSRWRECRRARKQLAVDFDAEIGFPNAASILKDIGFKIARGAGANNFVIS